MTAKEIKLKSYKERIIVSFTSYPARIDTVHVIVECMLKQTIMPDKIVLYLAEEQFPGREIPENLCAYIGEIFEIHWCDEDLKSHKKYYYAFQEFREDIVITIDDDLIYPERMIEELLDYYGKYPQCILARRAKLMLINKNKEIAKYEEWYNVLKGYVGIPRMDLFLTTGGGTLFPPHILGGEVFNKEVFMTICKHADDIWINLARIIYGIPTLLVKRFCDFGLIDAYQRNGLYENYNGAGGNDAQLKDVLEWGTQFFENREALLDKIFSKKEFFYEERELRYCQDMQYVLEDLCEVVEQNEEVVLYGAGMIAKRLAVYLQEKGLLNKLSAFAVKNTEENESDILGVTVRDIRQYVNTNTVIVLGVVRPKHDEVILELNGLGIANDRIECFDGLFWQAVGFLKKEQEKQKLKL